MDKLQKELTEHIDDADFRFDGLGKEIVEIRSNYMTEVGECRRSNDGLEQRLSKLEGVCGRLDSFSDSLQMIREGLNRHVSGLWSCVNGLNVTVTSQGDLIENIQNVQLENVHGDIHALNSSVVDLVKEFHSFVEQDFMGEFHMGPETELSQREGRSGAEKRRLKEESGLTSVHFRALDVCSLSDRGVLVNTTAKTFSEPQRVKCLCALGELCTFLEFLQQTVLLVKMFSLTGVF